MFSLSVVASLYITMERKHNRDITVGYECRSNVWIRCGLTNKPVDFSTYTGWESVSLTRMSPVVPGDTIYTMIC